MSFSNWNFDLPDSPTTVDVIFDKPSRTINCPLFVHPIPFGDVAKISDRYKVGLEKFMASNAQEKTVNLEVFDVLFIQDLFAFTKKDAIFGWENRLKKRAIVTLNEFRINLELFKTYMKFHEYETNGKLLKKSRALAARTRCMPMDCSED